MSVSNNELGELLIDLGLLTSEQLSDAMNEQQASGNRLTVVLSEMGLITERQLKDALELQYGVNFVNLSNSAEDYRKFALLVPEDVERKYRFVPVAKQGNQYTVAMVDPDDLVAADAVRVHLQSGNFKKLVCTADDFEYLMYFTYERVEEDSEQLEQTEEEESVSVDEQDALTNSGSPRASHTKLKSHMRNLFGADSDDDLDEMFGTESSDNVDALQEPITEPVAAEDEEVEESVPSGKKGKSITSLFGDDEDDDFADMDEEPAPPPPTAQKKKTNAKSKALKLEEAVEKPEAVTPNNQLLEHILEEAKSTKPAPKKSKKKSMQSLFDDDDDMDFGDGSDEPPADPQEEAPATEEEEPAIDEAPAQEAEPDEELAAAPSGGGGKSFKSLFGDDDDDDMDMESEAEPTDEEADSELASEPEVEESEPSEEEPAESEPEEEIETPEESEEEQPESSDGEESEPAEPSGEEEPTAQSAPSSGKPLRSLFDDDMDEDDLFQDAETTPFMGSLTGEDPFAVLAPDTVAERAVETESSEEIETTADETEPAEEMETAESLLSAIERPFQSLFDDEDDDEIFGTSEEEPAPETEPAAEEEQPEPQEEEPEQEAEPEPEPESEPEPEVESEPEAEPEPEMTGGEDEPAEPQEEEQEGRPDLEEIPLAYNSSFDDEMDEDSLFASASHPIPEGAPQLRDLLSRFDDPADALSNEPAEVTRANETSMAGEEPEHKKEAGLAVSALLAALDEQLPDEPTAISKSKPEVADDNSAILQDSGLHNQFVPEPEEEETADEPEQVEEQFAEAPEQEQEDQTAEPQAEEETKRTVAEPKSRRLRALMSDIDDEDSLEPAAALEASTTSGGVPAASDDDLETIDALIQHIEGGAEPPAPPEEKADFEEVLLLDKEELMPQYGSATSELPPVVVSNSAKTMTKGTSQEPAEAEAPDEQEAEVPGAAQTKVPPAAAFEPEDSSEAEPAERVSEIADHPTLFPTDSAYDLPPLPAIDDVLASVTNEIMDSVELANLSGNRTEISFLEEIVESELAISEDQNWEKEAQPAAQTPAAKPAPAPQPAVATQVAEPAAAPAPAAVAPQAVPSAAPPAAAAVAPAQQPAASAVPEQQDLKAPPSISAQLDPSILNLATQILTQAVNSPCSDVHFEPLADGLALRFMSEGELLDETILPAQIQGMLILCLKSMAGLDPAVVDRPQDKKFVTRSFGEPVEMRITSIPGIHGEMVAVSLKN